MLQDSEGEAPIHICANFHQSELSPIWRRFHIGRHKKLVFCGVQDSEGEAPIHICAREGLLGLAQTLCAFGCNVDLPNEDGMLPLHLGKFTAESSRPHSVFLPLYSMWTCPMRTGCCPCILVSLLLNRHGLSRYLNLYCCLRCPLAVLF